MRVQGSLSRAQLKKGASTTTSSSVVVVLRQAACYGAPAAGISVPVDLDQGKMAITPAKRHHFPKLVPETCFCPKAINLDPRGCQCIGPEVAKPAH